MTALQGLDARLRLARLHLVTDARRRQGDLAEFLAEALAGGVDVVQVRDADLTVDERRATLEVARAAAARTGALVGLAEVPAGPVDRGDLDLLHLGQAGTPSRRARLGLHPDALLGRSTHDEHQVDAAVADEDLDFFSVGPVPATSVEPDSPPVGLGLVRYAAASAPVFTMTSKPWFAAGGITADNLAALVEAGARRVCVGRAVTQASDPRGAARALADVLREAWRSDPAAERYTFAAAASPGRGR